MSTNFEDLILRDTTANKPAAGIPGRLFYDTTLEKLERDTGVAWEDCEPPAVAGDMEKSTYDTDEDGTVNAADEATAVSGVVEAGNSKYYGTDGSGTPGFHDLPEGGEVGGADILEVQVFS